MSMGTGNTIVLLFSAEMLFRVWRYLQRCLHNVTVHCSSTIMDRNAADLSCRAAGLSTMTSAASLRALLALCSPSAAITLALASLEQGVRPGCCVESINVNQMWEFVFVRSSDLHGLHPGSSHCPGSLGLRGHGSLEGLRDPDVLNLNPLHSDAPGIRGLVQRGLRVVCDQTSNGK